MRCLRVLGLCSTRLHKFPVNRSYCGLTAITMSKRNSTDSNLVEPLTKKLPTGQNMSGAVGEIQQVNSQQSPVQSNQPEKKDDNSVTEPKVPKEVKEGKATILFPETVFYNPVQEFNRDLTVAVITQYATELAGETPLPEPGVKCEKGLKILEAFGASGLRSIRFAKEIPGVKEIICNDFDDKAVEYINKNIETNEVGNLVKANQCDAALVMQMCRTYDSKYDVIDLDPYGSPSQFLDGALVAIKDGGLLCVTATDMAVMSGNFGETCFNKYGSYAIRTKSCHEMGLRILLRSIESHATRYSKYTVPILSVSVDFYVRVFVRVYESAAQAKFSGSKQGMLYLCSGCGAQAVQPLGISEKLDNGQYRHSPGVGPPVGQRCDHCGSRHKIAGPIWLGRLHDREFVSRLLTALPTRPILGTSRRMTGILKMVHEELEDIVLYYVLEEFARTLHCVMVPAIKFRSALLNAGYLVSGTHANKNAVKTNAPMPVVWDVLRLWVQQNPVSQKRLANDPVARTILEIPCSIDVSFELHARANPESREQGLLRFQMNPQKDWGPMARPKAEADGTPKKRKNKKKKKFEPKRLPCKKFVQGKCELAESECKYHHQGNFICSLDADGNPKPKPANLPETENGADGEIKIEMDETTA